MLDFDPEWEHIRRDVVDLSCRIDQLKLRIAVLAGQRILGRQPGHLGVVPETDGQAHLVVCGVER